MGRPEAADGRAVTWYWLALIPFMALVFAMTSNILDHPGAPDE